MKQQGIILITVLLILMMIQLLVISQMRLIQIHIKNLNALVADHESIYRLEEVAAQLKKNRVNSCISHFNNILQQTKEHKSCLWTLNQHDYYYAWEALGNFACIQRQENGQKFSTDHWRLTVTDGSQKLSLQIRYAEKIPLQICHGPIQMLDSEKISWDLLD